MTVEIYEGDCLSILPTLAENSIDSVVTDPPYHLTQLSRGGSPRTNDPKTPFGRTRLADKGFMQLNWDGGGTSFRPETWAEILRVLKPGGHLLSFGGTRTFHHMAVAIEAAGFEFRDLIMFNYGTGFPKGQNISNQIDKMMGTESTVIGTVDTRGMYDGRERLSSAINTGWRAMEGRDDLRDLSKKPLIVPSTEAAQQWDGWNPSLKPAYEPIILARKPISEQNVAANVLKHGTGALNIKACRIPTKNRPLREVAPFREGVAYHGNSLAGRVDGSLQSSKAVGETDLGRWPANWIHDGSDEILKTYTAYGTNIDQYFQSCEFDEEESAYRLWYGSKATKADRAGSKHPTVKPISLMRYLCRLITPPGGIVLDPFAGSGTTGQAAIDEGFNAVLIEREEVYVNDCRRRLALWLS